MKRGGFGHKLPARAAQKERAGSQARNEREDEAAAVEVRKKTDEPVHPNIRDNIPPGCDRDHILALRRELRLGVPPSDAFVDIIMEDLELDRDTAHWYAVALRAAEDAPAKLGG